MIPFKKPKHQYFLGTKHPHIYLTHQEARCMTYFMRGLTLQQTAEKLNLSLGTVSSYSENMKRKLNLRSKKEMIKLISETDFAQFLNKIQERI